MHEMDRVFVYLARHTSIGLTYDQFASVPRGFADASWEVRKSQSGWLVNWQSAVISWGSKKQETIALSSCEAEIIALSEGAKDVVFIRKLVGGLENVAMDTPTELATDSKSAADIAYNPEHFGRVKHVERRWFFVRDMVEKMEIRVPLIGTADNLADFFTKPIEARTQFFAMRDKIMNVPQHASYRD